MKDVVLDEVMKDEIISREDFEKYFNKKQIVNKQKYQEYLNKKIYEQMLWNFPDFFPTQFWITPKNYE